MIDSIPSDKKFCECGCGIQINPNKRFKHGHNGRAERNARWKGGVSKSAAGYIWRYAPNHHFTGSHRYVYEHRLVWEEYHKATLLSWGNVHHINESKSDNRPENLEAMMIDEHSRRHGCAEDIIAQRRCSICKNGTYFRKYNKRFEWYKGKDGYVCRKCHRRLMYYLSRRVIEV